MKLIIFVENKSIELDIKDFSFSINNITNHLTITFIDKSYVDSIIKPLYDFFKGHGKVNRTDYENRLFVKIFTKDYFGIRVDE